MREYKTDVCFVFVNVVQKGCLLGHMGMTPHKRNIIPCYMLQTITYIYNTCQGILLVGGTFMKERLIINKKPLKGEDGYKIFSIRIKDESVENLDKLAKETNRSRNELINILLDYAIENSEVK